MRAVLQEGEEDSPLWREAASWSEICDYDDLTGQRDSCYLRSPMYSEATSSASGFLYTAMLLVYCDGVVQASVDRGRLGPGGVPADPERMRTTRVVVEGEVQSADDPTRNTLFARDSAAWAGTTLAFEARHADNSKAVWRLPFGALERQVVDEFLNGVSCPRPQPKPEPPPKPVMVEPVRVSGSEIPYPKKARRAGVRGFLSLRLAISETGDVADVEVVRESYFDSKYGRKRDQLAAQEELTKAAVETVRQWKYRLATLDGEPVAAYSSVQTSYGIVPRALANQ